MQEKLKISVIGLGKMGLLHAGLVNAHPRAELISAAEPNEFLIKSFGAFSPRCKVYADYQPMLDETRPDAVMITSPTHLHVPMAIECVNRGIHVFIEKPLAITAEQAAPLVALLETKPVTNMVGFMGRYSSTFKKAREILQSGALDQVVSVNGNMYVAQLFTRGKGWRYDPAFSGGGVVITQNSHLIDCLYWLLGPFQNVHAQVFPVYSEKIDDFAHVMFTLKGGVRGWFDASWSKRHHRMVEMSVHIEAKNGTLDVTDDELKIFLEEPSGGLNAGWTILRKPDLQTGVYFDIGGPGYALQDEEFILACLEKKPVESDVRSAYHVQQVIEAIYRSSNENGANMEVRTPGVGRS